MHLIELVLHLTHPRRSNNHRPRLIHPEGFMVVAFVALAFVSILSLARHPSASPLRQVLGYATAISREQVVTLTNQKRAALGLGALTLDDTLNQAAQHKAEDMFAHQYWAHTSPQGKEPWDFIRDAGYSYQAAGENLARDFAATGEMVDAWMNSPTHRANIVNPRYEQIGVAVVNGTLDGTATTLVVQMFGRPRSDGNKPAIAPAARTVVADQAVRSVANSQPATAHPLELTQPATTDRPGILAAVSIMSGSLRPWPIVTPLQLIKAFFLSLLVLLMAVLLYDWVVASRSRRARIVGHNLAHLLFFGCIVFLLLSFHSGAIQ